MDKLKPFWRPTKNDIIGSNIYSALKDLDFKDYDQFFNFSILQKQEFWQYTIKKLGILFEKDFSPICRNSNILETLEWLPDSKFNIAASCFQANPQDIAIIQQSETSNIETFTYGQLKRSVNGYARILKISGFNAGDILGFIMPMNFHAVALYLSILQIGASACLIAESFAADEIATRLEVSQAKAVFTSLNFVRNGKILDLYDKVKQACPHLSIYLTSESTISELSKIRDIDQWLPSPFECEPLTDFHPCSAQDFISILFSSGTTKAPKAIPWHHSTPIKAASDAFYHLDVHPREIVSWPTSMGWMMGPFLIFATLINKACLALFNGSPLSENFAKFIETAKVTHLGIVPSLIQAWREQDILKKVKWQQIRLFASTGECSNAQDMQWLSAKAGLKPIIEYCGGTEIGGAYITSTILHDFIPTCFSTPTLGLDFVLLNEAGEISSEGEVALIPPSIGLSSVLLNQDHSLVYYQGMPHPKYLHQHPHDPHFPLLLRRHGDALVRHANGYYQVLGRTDDSMNLGGIKVSSAEIERSLQGSELYSETAAIAINPQEGGPSELIVFYVAKTSNNETMILKEMQQKIRENLNPLFKISKIIAIEQLPRTASNKIMRRVLRNLVKEK